MVLFCVTELMFVPVTTGFPATSVNEPVPENGMLLPPMNVLRLLQERLIIHLRSCSKQPGEHVCLVVRLLHGLIVLGKQQGLCCWRYDERGRSSDHAADRSAGCSTTTAHQCRGQSGALADSLASNNLRGLVGLLEGVCKASDRLKITRQRRTLLQLASDSIRVDATASRADCVLHRVGFCHELASFPEVLDQIRVLRSWYAAFDLVLYCSSCRALSLA